MKRRKLYMDPSLSVTEFPAGLFEVYTPLTGGGERNLLISPLFSGKTIWKKRHTMLRFYLFKKGVVISWRQEPGRRALTMQHGVFSASIGKLVVNIFPREIQK